MQAYEYGTEPYDHQRAVFESTRDLESHGLFLEQGLGKSKVIADNAAYLWGQGKIDALVVIAPSGVHRSWVSGDEDAGDHAYGHVGKHLPGWVEYRAAYWASDARKKEKKAIERVAEPVKDSEPRFLRVFSVNIEAIGQSKRAYDYVLWFVKTFRCLVNVDESTKIKARNKRTTRVLELAKHAEYRRLTSGEPAPEGPVDLFYQLKFLEDHPLGFGSFYAFRNRYAVLRERRIPHPSKPGKEITFQEIVKYVNVEELNEKLSGVSTSMRKEDCLDLPDRTYDNRHVQVTAEQKRLYNEIVDDYLYRIDPSRAEDELDGVEVTRAITRLLRAQQVLGGFLPDENGNTIAVKGANPKMESLVDEYHQLPSGSKLIVWSAFKPEQDAIAARFREELGSDDAVVEYHGRVAQADRETNKARFQNDADVKVFVGSPKAGQYDLTLTAARYVVWYSWNDALEPYIQANDRVHRIGATDTIRYLHLVVPGSVEAKSLGRLMQKQSLSQSLRTFRGVKQLMEEVRL